MRDSKGNVISDALKNKPENILRKTIKAYIDADKTQLIVEKLYNLAVEGKGNLNALKTIISYAYGNPTTDDNQAEMDYLRQVVQSLTASSNPPKK